MNLLYAPKSLMQATALVDIINNDENKLPRVVKFKKMIVDGRLTDVLTVNPNNDCARFLLRRYISMFFNNLVNPIFSNYYSASFDLLP